MKVLLVNTYDGGGAANSCIRLHLGLIEQPKTDSKLLLYKKIKQVPKSFEYNQVSSNHGFFKKISRKSIIILNEILPTKFRKKKVKTKKEEFISNRSVQLEMFSFPNSGIDITKSSLYGEADIINLHWVGNFLDFQSFFEKNTKPVVWTLHDMNPFLGGEHYKEQWKGMTKEGIPIPRIVSEEENNWLEENLDIKKKALQNVTNLEIVAPSRWLADEAKNSELFSSFNVHCIPYGLNADIFKPITQSFSRDVFGIPLDKEVVLFVADTISNSRKGFEFLIKAFEELDRKDILLCAVGSISKEVEAIPNVLQLGVVKDERLMSLAYSAANVFVIPSLMDNLPNTVLESLFCGTPVIGFPVGGILDMIEPEVNGYLTKGIDSHSLAQTINLFLENSHQFDRDVIREKAVAKYDQSIQASSYMKLFDELLRK